MISKLEFYTVSDLNGFDKIKRLHSNLADAITTYSSYSNDKVKALGVIVNDLVYFDLVQRHKIAGFKESENLLLQRNSDIHIFDETSLENHSLRLIDYLSITKYSSDKRAFSIEENRHPNPVYKDKCLASTNNEKPESSIIATLVAGFGWLNPTEYNKLFPFADPFKQAYPLIGKYLFRCISDDGTGAECVANPVDYDLLLKNTKSRLAPE